MYLTQKILNARWEGKPKESENFMFLYLFYLRFFTSKYTFACIVYSKSLETITRLIFHVHPVSK